MPFVTSQFHWTGSGLLCRTEVLIVRMTVVSFVLGARLKSSHQINQLLINTLHIKICSFKTQKQIVKVAREIIIKIGCLFGGENAKFVLSQRCRHCCCGPFLSSAANAWRLQSDSWTGRRDKTHLSSGGHAGLFSQLQRQSGNSERQKTSVGLAVVELSGLTGYTPGRERPGSKVTVCVFVHVCVHAIFT